MAASLPVALVLLLASPNVSEPEQAFQKIVASVRSGEILAVWDLLSSEAQEKLQRGLRRKLKGEVPPDGRKVFEQFVAEQRNKNPRVFDALAGLQVKVGTVERNGDVATFTASTIVLGMPARGTVVMVKRGGAWKLKDVAAPAKRAKKTNELMAIATLRNTLAAQAQFQSIAIVDRNNDGLGEYGTYAELAGAVECRGTQRRLQPPVLGPAFAKLAGGRVTRGGYHFRIYLPGPKGAAVAEKADAKLAETAFCVYAWPVAAGQRAFFINQTGVVIAVEGSRYSGDRAPPPYAAFALVDGKPATAITGKLSPGKPASDGLSWKPVG